MSAHGLHPTSLPACEDRTFIICARVIRGINSIAKADMPASAIGPGGWSATRSQSAVRSNTREPRANAGKSSNQQRACARFQDDRTMPTCIQGEHRSHDRGRDTEFQDHRFKSLNFENLLLTKRK